MNGQNLPPSFFKNLLQNLMVFRKINLAQYSQFDVRQMLIRDSTVFQRLHSQYELFFNLLFQNIGIRCTAVDALTQIMAGNSMRFPEFRMRQEGQEITTLKKDFLMAFI